MRIRKHASKAILGTAWSLPWSPPPQTTATTPPQASYTAAWPLAEVCELNQSPWDAMLSPPRDHDYPNHPKVEDGGIMGIKTEASKQLIPGVVNIAVPKRRIAIKKEVMEKESINTSSSSSSSSRKYVKKEKKKRKVANDKTKSRVVAAASSGICKKTDGKKWRCKNRVHPPHSLCSYHLAQLRSYNNPTAATTLGRSQRNKAAAKPKVNPRSDAGSDDFYYYSAFGPWRGKRRSRDGGSGGCRDDEIAAENGGGCDGDHMEPDHVSDDAPAIRRDDDAGAGAGAAAEVIEGGYDDSDEEHSDEDEEEEGRNTSQKRRRKPIKARSLKSLL